MVLASNNCISHLFSKEIRADSIFWPEEKKEKKKSKRKNCIKIEIFQILKQFTYFRKEDNRKPKKEDIVEFKTK